MSSENLLCCPFCGGAANVKSISYEGDPARSDWWASCQVCRVERPSTKKSEIVHSREEAIAAWNRRADDADRARLVAQVALLEAELAEAHESLQRFGDEAAQDDGSGLSDEPGYLGSVTWKGWKVDLYDDDEEAADNG